MAQLQWKAKFSGTIDIEGRGHVAHLMRRAEFTRQRTEVTGTVDTGVGMGVGMRSCGQ